MEDKKRAVINITGAVQGVGFRPFVYNLAKKRNLTGYVLNDTLGVLIEAEGVPELLTRFLDEIKEQSPTNALIDEITFSLEAPENYDNFIIKESFRGGEKKAFLLPDLATCPDCLNEILDSRDKRYGYPFTNCTYCGPRFTIVDKLPYDRESTTMDEFDMCPRCLKEFKTPEDRRFHAQANTCPVCGPQYTLLDKEGNIIANNDLAIAEGAKKIKDGFILAMKGIGGFHLMADPFNETTIELLRKRKKRAKKPFALMIKNTAQVKKYCLATEEEEKALTSPTAPIVLIRQKNDTELPSSIAPENPYLGVMLPYSPAHHLLLEEIGSPIIATSGNLTNEPICTDNNEAIKVLSHIADFFLVHNRQITRHADDSIVRIINKAPQILRRARGFAPLPVIKNNRIPVVLAVGGHLKNTISLSTGGHVFTSQYIGDLENYASVTIFKKIIKEFLNIYDVKPDIIACDMHPEYASSRWVRAEITRKESPFFGIKTVALQHHEAHLAACLAENEVHDDLLGIVWDGTGYGRDGSIWGGEFFTAQNYDFNRVARLKPFLLPGGDKAAKEPARTAISLLWQMFGEEIFNSDDLAAVNHFTRGEKNILAKMLDNQINSPRTSSMGRLFDGISSIINLNHKITFEGQAAMALEFAASKDIDESYPFVMETSPENSGLMDINWQPMVSAIIEDLRQKRPCEEISACFHNTLTDMILKVAEKTEKKYVALSGGCFQNKLLLEKTVVKLKSCGYRPVLHKNIPSNDGGISVGQIMLAKAYLEKENLRRNFTAAAF